MSAVRAQKPVEGLEAGDEVYVRHPTRGVSIVKVRAVGKHGFQCDDEDGVRQKLHHDSYLGHKSRMLHTYELVDQGADGVVVQRQDGQRRFLRGELPKEEDSGDSTATGKDDDPLLAGLDELTAKALRPLTGLSGWILKAGGNAVRFDPTRNKREPKPRPGGKAANGNAPPGGPHKVGKEAKGPALHRHGDRVRFRHGDVEGEGVIVASGKDGVTVKTDDGREHQIRHDALLPPNEEDKQARAEAKEKPTGTLDGGSGKTNMSERKPRAKKPRQGDAR